MGEAAEEGRFNSMNREAPGTARALHSGAQLGTSCRLKLFFFSGCGLRIGMRS